MIYLDHAAATPVDPRVLQTMQPYFTEQFYNPSAQYMAAQQVRGALEAARSSVAQQLGARGSEVVFTAGGTEANNLAIHGVLRQYPGAEVVVSAVEHDSVLAPAAQYACKIAPVTEQCVVDVAQLATNITDNTVLVSIMYANNEVGTIQPIRQVAELVARVRDARRKAGVALPLYLHTDACQAANYLDIHVSRLGVDLLTLNGGKIYGPKQSGVLYVSSRVQLAPLVLGGGQERGLRSGTENVPGAIGFAKALDSAGAMRHEEFQRLATLQQLAYKLIGEQLPSAVANGSRKQRLPNNIHLTLPGADNERLLVQLDERGIAAAAGSACSASSEESSHVLLAMGITEDAARASLRFTMGRSTTEQDIRKLVSTLKNLYH